MAAAAAPTGASLPLDWLALQSSPLPSTDAASANWLQADLQLTIVEALARARHRRLMLDTKSESVRSLSPNGRGCVSSVTATTFS